MPSASPAITKPYTLTNLGGGRASLDIRGTIGISQDMREWGYEAAGTVTDFDRDLKALGEPTEIEMNIHSDGGLVWVALGMHDILVRHSARIIANVDGIAASAATILLMAADVINVPANSYLFIHDPEMPAAGNHRDMAKAATKLKQWARDLANIYTDRIEDTKGGSRPEILANVIRLMEEETYLTGRDAVELGLADRVTTEINLAAYAPSAGPRATAARLDKVPGAIRHLFDTSGQTQTQDPASLTITPTNMSEPAITPAPAAPAAAPAPAAPAAAPVAAAPAADPSTVVAPVVAAPTAAAPPAPAPLSPDAGGAAPQVAAPTNQEPAAPVASGPVTMEAIGALLTNTIAPLQQQITTLQTEVDTQKNLHAAGVSPTAWGGNQQPAPNIRSGDPGAAPVDFTSMSPRALIKMGRDRMTAKP